MFLIFNGLYVFFFLVSKGEQSREGKDGKEEEGKILAFEMFKSNWQQQTGATMDSSTVLPWIISQL